ncbi:MAG TPA: dihydroneopterin aldolase [Candidatus Kapabacteria bacterium]|nr:dihydroneopterin aldolase [Candidatus Kapabacteria bacterium]
MSSSENITITLSALKLFAHHGAYPEERERGNEFEIDLSVEMPKPIATITDDLEDTIDYVSLAECVHLVSSEKHYAVLEAFAYDVCKEVLELHPEVIRVTIEVKKLHPPMPHRVESVGVRLTLP